MGEVGLRMMGKDPSNKATGVLVSSEGALRIDAAIVLAERSEALTIGPGETVDLIVDKIVNADQIRATFRRESGGSLRDITVDLIWKTGQNGAISWIESGIPLIVSSSFSRLVEDTRTKVRSPILSAFRIKNNGSQSITLSGYSITGTHNGSDSESIKTIDNGDGTISQSVQVMSELLESTPSYNIKTIRAQEPVIVSAASSPRVNRKKMIIKNLDSFLSIRVGFSNVTQQTGIRLNPGASIEFTFNPSKLVNVYAISEGASVRVEVLEI